MFRAAPAGVNPQPRLPVTFDHYLTNELGVSSAGFPATQEHRHEPQAAQQRG